MRQPTSKHCQECGGRGSYYTEWGDVTEAELTTSDLVVLDYPDPPDGTVCIQCPVCGGEVTRQ